MAKLTLSNFRVSIVKSRHVICDFHVYFWMYFLSMHELFKYENDLWLVSKYLIMWTDEII